ncbi:hypothetical protein VIGAN_09059900 [Vigna angularis var. angularis]|uniref:Uncharacterized protein n=1 Tax=Vigna angularis var. angularis TaxID=157739 RepID=A0A0S3SWH5_PHAAN|nr:hypothetical protein VIGAN_09059900 [Vigna angularis var. angularis]
MVRRQETHHKWGIHDQFRHIYADNQPLSQEIMDELVHPIIWSQKHPHFLDQGTWRTTSRPSEIRCEFGSITCHATQDVFSSWELLYNVTFFLLFLKCSCNSSQLIK